MKGKMRRIGSFLIAVAMLLSLVPALPSVSASVPEEGYQTTRLGNPYMPLWEHVPDGEPHLFHDPDNPGKMRVYVYGSHDTLRNAYCGREHVLWSAPEDDLQNWRYEGVIFVSDQNADGDFFAPPDTLWAPDACEVADASSPTGYWYYLYPFSLGGGRTSMVAKSSRPDGPFTVINWNADNPNVTDGPIGGDPAVLVDTDGRVYAYWGGYPGMCEIDPENMYMNKGEIINGHIPSYHAGDEEPHRFFEGSSIRKVGDTYVFLYNRVAQEDEPGYTGAACQLAYAWSLSPFGPWTYGGVIVDPAGEVIPDGDGGYIRTFSYNNTHGSIEQINGQWYVFYHRSPNVVAPDISYFSRQAMVEPIEVEYNEQTGEVHIEQVQMTSNGFALNGLDPYCKTPFGIASYATGSFNFQRVDDPAVDNMPLVDLKDGSVIGIKHFNFAEHAPEGETTYLEVGLVPQGVDAEIEVLLRDPALENTAELGEVIGTIALKADMPQVYTTVRIPVPAVDGLDAENAKQGVFFRFVKEDDPQANICQLYDLQFVLDEEEFSDSFEGGLENWTIRGQANVENGALYLAEQTQVTALHGEKWESYSFQTELLSYSGAFQMLFCQSDSQNYYELMLEEQTLTLSCVEHGQKEELQSAAYTGALPAEFAIDVNNGIVYLYE